MNATAKNGIRFDYSTNPELAAIFKGWKPGESYTVEVTFQLNDMDDAGANCTIEKIAVDESGEEEKEIEANADQPVMIVVKAGTPPESTSPEMPYVPG